jgi:hypothetical protein
MPLTFLVTAALALAVAGSLAGGASRRRRAGTHRSGLAAAIVGREEVPGRCVTCSTSSPASTTAGAAGRARAHHYRRRTDVEYSSLAGELALGVALGVAVPLAAVALLRSRFTAATSTYESSPPSPSA